ncbi:carbohydrate-binding protein [Pseudobacteroides cellulosolvens]|uniref:Carbohydrate binding family 25 n=1 Tax=Pseudobacteroides cellulosolvens ATCC 35603 = DSM 2933 TaxID=398512 RepID=A0A0L6JML4_9FIRM|nr:carbohydrate-binding protein [Pseudobacteroides cellulosolvens]KNY26622.1 Carbohydrate binding family 25 [Pseudobacteroides cellulosolvens ATCC 35603 = DSM 2933]
MSLNSQPYAENGVLISDYSLSVGDEVTITYEGILAKSGADQIFLHIGYGKEWLDKAFLPMENENGVFKGTFKIALPDDLNISFKDSADNWDNNSSMNYSFVFTGKAKAAKKSTAKSTTKKENEDEPKEVKKTAKATTEKKSSTKSKSQSTDEIKETKAASTAKKDPKSTAKASTKPSSKASKTVKDK